MSETLIPVLNSKSKLQRVSIGSGGNGTYSATSIPGYESLTADNFAFIPTGASGTGEFEGTGSTGRTFLATGNTSTSPSISYNASTGVVTLSGCSASTESNYNKSGASGKTRGFVSVWGGMYCYHIG